MKSLSLAKPTSDPILIEKPNLIMASIKQLEADLKMTKDKLYPKIENKDEFISELALACNYLTV